MNQKVDFNEISKDIGAMESLCKKGKADVARFVARLLEHLGVEYTEYLKSEIAHYHKIVDGVAKLEREGVLTPPNRELTDDDMKRRRE